MSVISSVQRGFSLVELAVVLVVVGLLLGMILRPLGAGYEQSKRHQAMLQLDEIRDALIGFAAANGRLPCPAAADSAGQESQYCDEPHGFVPSAALGISGHFNSAGLLLDPWGNPLRYSVSLADTDSAGTPGRPDFVSENEMHEVGMSRLKADLVICATATQGTCSGGDIRANQVPAVIYSLGKDPSAEGHQSENLDSDGVFVVRSYSQIEGERFDDIIVWLSDSLLFTRLLQAGTLP
ncbi:prepilin-type N-terminal cleavage/methylation domain-containing protein [Granulosicoccaceae sp. 1_MG-2023]|nr:prepilin-type N-terminal cleavage/methylation domain-containing protein [Granulosicoccaceae sp. 1_MG-2023]